MAFVSRRDGKICGVFVPRQYEGQEELPDDHPEVVAFQNPLPTQTELNKKADEDELRAIDASKITDPTQKLLVKMAQRNLGG